MVLKSHAYHLHTRKNVQSCCTLPFSKEDCKSTAANKIFFMHASQVFSIKTEVPMTRIHANSHHPFSFCCTLYIWKYILCAVGLPVHYNYASLLLILIAPELPMFVHNVYTSFLKCCCKLCLHFSVQLIKTVATEPILLLDENYLPPDFWWYLGVSKQWDLEKKACYIIMSNTCMCILNVSHCVQNSNHLQIGKQAEYCISTVVWFPILLSRSQQYGCVYLLLQYNSLTQNIPLICSSIAYYKDETVRCVVLSTCVMKSWLFKLSNPHFFRPAESEHDLVLASTQEQVA